jgi:cobalt-zinc-cadmium efflux system protein
MPQHDHDHDHHHGHSHAPRDFGRSFAVGIILNTAYVIVEAGYGLASHSMALVADAGHNLSDVLGLFVAWGAVVLARRPPSPRFTYGFGGSSILAALFNAVFLLIAVGAIAWESVLRLTAPPPVATGTMMGVAAIGIAVNGFTAWMFAGGSKGDLNIRGAYLHMAADAAVSLGVVAAGLLIMLTGWQWADPVASLAIVAVIAASAWGLLRDSLQLSLGVVPGHIDTAAVSAFLRGLPGVASVHDLHIWPLGTTQVALTAHLVMPQGAPGDEFLRQAHHELDHDFGIGHAALQVERDGSRCPLAPDDVV